MSEFTGTVVKQDPNNAFGWIRYDPPNNDDDDQIYFMWNLKRDGKLPAMGAIVTFTREPDPENADSYIAKNVKVKK